MKKFICQKIADYYFYRGGEANMFRYLAWIDFKFSRISLRGLYISMKTISNIYRRPA